MARNMSASRDSLLKEIRARMEQAGIFDEAIWDRMLLTDTPVLQEIADSDFEHQVLRDRRERRRR